MAVPLPGRHGGDRGGAWDSLAAIYRLARGRPRPRRHGDGAILTLIDSGESEGFVWYVLPYVRGESLREKLTREKQLSIEETVRIATQAL